MNNPHRPYPNNLVRKCHSERDMHNHERVQNRAFSNKPYNPCDYQYDCCGGRAGSNVQYQPMCHQNYEANRQMSPHQYGNMQQYGDNGIYHNIGFPKQYVPSGKLYPYKEQPCFSNFNSHNHSSSEVEKIEENGCLERIYNLPKETDEEINIKNQILKYRDCREMTKEEPELKEQIRRPKVDGRWLTEQRDKYVYYTTKFDMSKNCKTKMCNDTRYGKDIEKYSHYDGYSYMKGREHCNSQYENYPPYPIYPPHQPQPVYSNQYVVYPEEHQESEYEIQPESCDSSINSEEHPLEEPEVQSKPIKKKVIKTSKKMFNATTKKKEPTTKKMSNVSKLPKKSQKETQKATKRKELPKKKEESRISRTERKPPQKPVQYQILNRNIPTPHPYQHMKEISHRNHPETEFIKFDPCVHPEMNPQHYKRLPPSFVGYIEPAGRKIVKGDTASECMHIFD